MDDANVTLWLLLFWDVVFLFVGLLVAGVVHQVGRETAGKLLAALTALIFGGAALLILAGWVNIYFAEGGTMPY